jgi:predicted RNA binding protein YcfA (HicA-like mRNA interferase family)
MPPKVRQIRAEVRNAGFRRELGKGSHSKWEHELLPGVKIVISGNDGDDAKPYQIKQVRDALAKLEEAKRRRP